MKSLKMRIVKAVGLHPSAPRWLKMQCLRITMRHIAKEIGNAIESMTPEQRAEFDKKIGNLQA